ncbi:hypothetical protein [uncultured Citricoccus sp.]|uniref:hypothetical protein n=1 Tax=uncultured Citricoccus sp. TaxID=614031 RepID=UPI00261BE7E7|nr:hypothetical protein [uncultured Citricoccus sp.]
MTKKNEDLDVAEVLAGADAELSRGDELRKLEAQILSAPKSGDDPSKTGVEVTMMCVIYNDPEAPASHWVNPSRIATLRVFEAKHGRIDFENFDEQMWMLWHTLGRPGANGVKPVEPAIGPAENRVFTEWLESVESPAVKTVTRGKASS